MANSAFSAHVKLSIDDLRLLTTLAAFGLDYGRQIKEFDAGVLKRSELVIAKAKAIVGS